MQCAQQYVASLTFHLARQFLDNGPHSDVCPELKEQARDDVLRSRSVSESAVPEIEAFWSPESIANCMVFFFLNLSFKNL
jgi:hypothetical protein